MTARPAVAILATACMLAASAASAQSVGRVLMSSGTNSVVRDGKVVTLAYGSALQARDTIETGPRSNLQVRFNDESIMSFREQSRMRIDDFRFSGKADGTENAVFSLLKGAFRTVTGLVGRADHSRYAVRTSTATIGIRGTMYSAALCEQDCFNTDGSRAPDGLYGTVTGPSMGTNQLTLTNDATLGPDGKRSPQVIGQGQTFYVASATSLPGLLLEPPSHLTQKFAASGGKLAAAAGAAAGPSAAGAGIAGDSRPNLLPSAAEQVGLTLTGTPNLQLQNLRADGTPASVPPIQTHNADFGNIGGTGVVRGQMLWTTTADMDLHMLTPDNQHTYYGNSPVNFPAGAPTATATLDVDNTQGVNHPSATVMVNGTRYAAENIQVNGASVPAGNYTFYTRNYSGPTTAPVLILSGDNGATGARFNVPALGSGATSGNYVVTRNPNGSASYSGPGAP